MKVSIKTLKNRADKFRTDWNTPAGGMVVFYNGGKDMSWVPILRDPESWPPGVIAMSAEGQCWRAIGGDAINGAKEWRPIERDSAYDDTIMGCTTTKIDD